MAIKRKNNIQDAKMQIVLRFPFYASLMFRHEAVATTAIPTACVDAKGKIYYNPEWAAQRTVGECVFVLAHELMHVVYAHLPRRGNKNAEVWNIATDAVINRILIADSVGDFIDGCVNIDWVTADMTAEQVYEALMRDPNKQPSGGVGELSDLQGNAEDECGTPMTNGDINEAIANGKRELAEAATMERMRSSQRGSGSSATMIAVDNYIASTVPWYDVLERYCASKVSAGINWARPNKRFQSVYMPSRGKRPSMGRICVGVDTSGSIDDEMIGGFFGHLNAIVEMCNPAGVDILYCTSEIEHHDEFTMQDYPLEPQHNRWCGGTDMRVITEWVDNSENDYDVVVIFTDGYTPKPESCKADVLWVLNDSSNRDNDFIGEVVRV